MLKNYLQGLDLSYLLELNSTKPSKPGMYFVLVAHPNSKLDEPLSLSVHPAILEWKDDEWDTSAITEEHLEVFHPNHFVGWAYIDPMMGNVMEWLEESLKAREKLEGML